MCKAVRIPMALGALLLAVAAVQATTLHVPDPYPTIQAALQAAVAGDTVEVACGTYTNYTDIHMKSGVVLRSETGDPDCVVLSPPPFGISMIICTGVNEATVIEGFTLTDASDCSALGCEAHAAPTIRHCIFRDNVSHVEECAGGITCYDSSPVIEDCIFVENIGWTGNVGAIMLWGSDATVTHCTFRNNNVDAIRSVGGPLRMDHATFVSYIGRANIVFLGWGATAWIDNCIFAYNYLAPRQARSDEGSQGFA